MNIDYKALAENACCAWEWMLERKAKKDRRVMRYLDDYGYADARWFCTCLAQILDEAYTKAVNDYGFCDAFDWEFVPWFMNECVDWEPHEPAVHPDYMDRIKSVFGHPGKQATVPLEALLLVCGSAEIRAEQYSMLAEGRTPSDVVDELYQVSTKEALDMGRLIKSAILTINKAIKDTAHEER